MKIYTKQGDEGITSLVGGAKVSKDDVQVEAYGTLDELNAHVGLLLAVLRQVPVGKEKLEEVVASLHCIQGNIFKISTLMATEKAPKSTDNKPLNTDSFELTNSDVTTLEHAIDTLTASLPKKSAFIYPGGVEAACQSHVCRTVCRRAERRIVALSKLMKIGGETLPYMNRLSDFFFVLARYLNFVSDEDEKKWEISCK